MAVDPFARRPWTRLASRVETVLAEFGATLVDLDVRQGRYTLIRIALDHPRGVDLVLCTRVTRRLQAAIPWDEIFPGDWRLEVSSPGVERILRSVREFQWARGRPVRVWVRTDRGPRVVEGRLHDFTPESLVIQTADGYETFVWTQVHKVRLAEPVETP